MQLKPNVEGKTGRVILLGLVLLLQIYIFAPYVGTGFVTDDFNWIESVVRDGEVRYMRSFTATTGFFRPFVGLSFAVQYALHGMDPKPYGLFNLFLHLANILLLYLLLSRRETTKPLALPAAALFALNAKAVNMAVIWISARTTLLCTFFLLLSFYMFQVYQEKRGHLSWFTKGLVLLLTALFYLGSLLSKETAAAAPLLIFLFAFFPIAHRTRATAASLFQRLKTAVLAVIPFALPLLVYFLMRFNSDAFTPFNAPHYYRYTFAPGLILKNLSEYIIRSGIFDIYIALITFLGLLLLRRFIHHVRRINGKSHSSSSSGALSPKGGIGVIKRLKDALQNPGPGLWGLMWFFVFLLPMFPLAARSDLYAYFPQIGLHVVFLVLLGRMVSKILPSALSKGPMEQAQNTAQKGTQNGMVHSPFSFLRPPLVVAVVIPLVLLLAGWGFYLRQRAGVAAQKADHSSVFCSRVLSAGPALSQLPNGTPITVYDYQYGTQNKPNAGNERSPHKTVAYGFAPMLNLYFPGKGFSGEIVPAGTPAKPGTGFTWKDNRLTQMHTSPTSPLKKHEGTKEENRK